MKLLLCMVAVHVCVCFGLLQSTVRQRIVSFHVVNQTSMADPGPAFSHVSKVKCTLICFERTPCTSVFYWKSEGICRTNTVPQAHAEHGGPDNATRQDLKVNRQDPNSEVTKQDPERKVYYGVLRNPCADHKCSSGRRCSVHSVSKAPLCLEVATVCSEEQVPNAICSYESKLTGAIRSCTCHGNYRDVHLDVVNVNNTCIVNGSWTQPSINCSGPYIRLTTPRVSRKTFQQISASNLQNITGGTSTLAFLVKTCHDADFALHTNPNTLGPLRYKLIMGGNNNRKSVIRRCWWCDPAVFHDESSIVSCNEYRPFWISWKNGVISAGKGLTVRNQAFMEWSPTSPIVINHISISSHVNNTGKWLFLQR